MATNVVRLNKDGQIEIDGVVFDIREFINKIDKKINLFIQDEKPDDYGVLDFWYAPTEDILSVSKFINDQLVFVEVTLAGKTLSASISGSGTGTGGVSESAVNNLATSLSAQIESVRTEYKAKMAASVNLSGVAAYHLLGGTVTVSNEVITNGMGIYTYTGNTTTLPSISLGMDIQSQWGDSVDETYGYYIEVKARSYAAGRAHINSMDGPTKYMDTTSTGVETTTTAMFTLSTVAGNTTLTLTSNTVLNTNGATYELTVYQTTHKKSGITNHGKAYTAIYNPIFGISVVNYNGSGTARHEIPNFLDRPTVVAITKSKTQTSQWSTVTSYGEYNLNDTLAFFATGQVLDLGMVSVDSNTTLVNGNNLMHTMICFSSSYLDANNKLIGNIEVGSYVGVANVSNMIFNVKAKPLKIIVKCIDLITNTITLNSITQDITWYNTTSIASAGQLPNFYTFDNDKVSVRLGNNDSNANNYNYFYIIFYDNDNGSGKSTYKKLGDTSRVSLNNCILPFPKGVDETYGSLVTNKTVNKTLTNLTTFKFGKNYIYLDSDLNEYVTDLEPYYGSGEYTGGDVYDYETNKWYTGVCKYINKFDSASLDPIITSNANVSLTQANGSLTYYSLVAAGDEMYINVSNLGLVNGKKYKLLLKGVASGYNIWVEYNSNKIYYNLLDPVGVGAFTYKTGVNNLVIKDGSSGLGNINFDMIMIYAVEDYNDLPDVTQGTPIAGSRHYLEHVVVADGKGQLVRVDKLPKTTYLQNINIDGGFNLNQDYQDIAAYRRVNVPYKNESNKPIFICVVVAIGNTSSLTIISVNGKTAAATAGTGAGSYYYSLYAMVPPGGVYKVITSTAALYTWREYR